jgi:Asp/Glu/hydantoin racemase
LPLTLAFIHTSHVLIPTFTALARRELPQVKTFHMVDESLIQNTIAAGHLTRQTTHRLVQMIGSANQAGAGAVMVTCSSIGPAIPVARAVYDFPVLRIDEAMAEQAVQSATRLGVIATLKTTLDPTVNLLRATAAERQRPVEVIESLCAGAFEKVIAGDTDTHDRMVSEALIQLGKQVDAVVLAQASMARVAEKMAPGALTVPVFSSPELAVRQARQILSE